MNSSRIVGGFIVYVNERHSLLSEFININVLRVRFQNSVQSEYKWLTALFITNLTSLIVRYFYYLHQLICQC
jgi:hypothetical protein